MLFPASRLCRCRSQICSRSYNLSPTSSPAPQWLFPSSHHCHGPGRDQTRSPLPNSRSREPQSILPASPQEHRARCDGFPTLKELGLPSGNVPPPRHSSAWLSLLLVKYKPLLGGSQPSPSCGRTPAKPGATLPRVLSDLQTPGPAGEVVSM